MVFEYVYFVLEKRCAPWSLVSTRLVLNFSISHASLSYIEEKNSPQIAPIRIRSYPHDGPRGPWVLVAMEPVDVRSLHLLNGPRSRWLEGPHLLVQSTFVSQAALARIHTA